MPDILVIKPSSLGDIVHGLLVIQSLREQIDECHIAWVVRDSFAPLLDKCGTVDEIIIYHRYGGWRKFISLLSEIRKREYDMVVDLQGLARSGLMTFASRSKMKLGRTDAREFSRWAYGCRAPLPAGGKNSHAVEILMQFLPLMNCESRLRGKLDFNNINPINFPIQFLEENALLIFPESRRSEKEWGGFPLLTQRLLKEKSDIKIIWCGSTQLESPESMPDGRFFNLTGKTAIDELTLLITKARLIVANDSGPIHLAAVMGVPVVALFGPTRPELFGPYPLDNPLHHVMRAPDGDLAELEVEPVLQCVFKALEPLH